MLLDQRRSAGHCEVRFCLSTYLSGVCRSWRIPLGAKTLEAKTDVVEDDTAWICPSLWAQDMGAQDMGAQDMGAQDMGVQDYGLKTWWAKTCLLKTKRKTTEP